MVHTREIPVIRPGFIGWKCRGEEGVVGLTELESVTSTVSR